jgi:hypothetical protein
MARSPVARTLLTCLAITVTLAPAVWAATPSALYRVVFQSQWSAQTHPVDYPSGAHFSPLIGTTHNDQVIFWQPGGLASMGIERMAEAGMSTPLDQEVAAAIAAGNALEFLEEPGFRSPGSIMMDFMVEIDMPRATLVSMLAPSPDWFVGVTGLPLLESGEWVPVRQVVLWPWDAGTDSGTTFRSANADTQPPVPIQRIVTGPLGNNVPIGTFTFVRLDATDSCIPTATALCLLDGRFTVSVVFTRPGEAPETATVDRREGQWGTFQFFANSQIPNAMVTMGPRPNGFYAVQVPPLQAAELAVTIFDHRDETFQVYRKGQGVLEAILDPAAFLQ